MHQMNALSLTYDEEQGDQRMIIATLDRKLKTVRSEMGMQCNIEELVSISPEPRNQVRFIADHAIFEGAAYLEDLEGKHLFFKAGSVFGSVSMAFDVGKFLAILSPSDMAAHSIWLSVPLDGLKIGTSGTIGVFKKRPELIELEGDEWSLTLSGVAQLFQKGYQSGKEQELLEALRA